MFTILHGLIFAGIVLVAYVAYKLWKAGKTVTVGTVIDGVKSDVKTVVAEVKSDVSGK